MRELRIYEDPSEVSKNLDYSNTEVNDKVGFLYYTKNFKN